MEEMRRKLRERDREAAEEFVVLRRGERESLKSPIDSWRLGKFRLERNKHEVENLRVLEELLMRAYDGEGVEREKLMREALIRVRRRVDFIVDAEAIG